MTELKCPYCNKQLQHAVSIDTHDFYWCPNYDCDSSSEMVGTEETWATIIDAEKKLDIALKCLKGVVKDLPWVKRTLDQITGLEQKDVK